MTPQIKGNADEVMEIGMTESDALVHYAIWTPTADIDTYCGLSSRKAFYSPFLATKNIKLVTCQCCKNDYARM